MQRIISLPHKLLYTMLITVAGHVNAQPWYSPTSLFLQSGSTGKTQGITAGATWDWAHKWTLGGGQLAGYWEVSMSEWSYPAADGRRTAWLSQIGLVPVFRYRPTGGTSPWFFEAGVGLTLMTSLYETDRKRFSTTFNFADHFAAGRNFGSRNVHELSLRLQHFSNAGIKDPNPGENFIQIRFTKLFIETTKREGFTDLFKCPVGTGELNTVVRTQAQFQSQFTSFFKQFIVNC
jgi:lipid A 3-O-deacylase